ncbi:hypothetical protein CFC21_061511 [Triticum aestivum]|uniref:SAP domain-containing protein n=3 Tax=Triticinae TaxID=1648030 RepID=A0A3B6JHD2_WHEAT|nr:hypothetical protein CFC21_061511 [Triticum aestivum]
MAAEGSAGGGGGRKTPLPHNPRERGAAKFLTGLPSRGNFSSSSISSNLSISDILEGQVIETDTTNILIRHLQLKKKDSEAKDAGSRTPGESGKGKRCAARSLGVQKSSKKPNLGSSSGLPSSDEAISGFSQHTLQSFTVERLRALLRQRGLTTKGKKDELITRLREAQS